MLKNKAVLLIFAYCIVILLNANAYPSISIKERLENLKTADLIGIKQGLPKGMGASIAWEESRGYTFAIGKNNTDNFCSFGIVQINETCEKELADRYLPGGYKNYDRFDLEKNCIVGFNYVLFLHKKYGNWKEAFCAYNWGPGNVDRTTKYSDIKLKTRIYAQNILSRITAKPFDYSTLMK